MEPDYVLDLWETHFEQLLVSDRDLEEGGSMSAAEKMIQVCVLVSISELSQ